MLWYYRKPELTKCKNLCRKYTDEGFIFILMKDSRFTRYFLLLNTDEPTMSGGQSVLGQNSFFAKNIFFP